MTHTAAGAAADATAGAAVANTHQSEAWNGYEGRHWADHQRRYDAVNSGFNPVLLDAADVSDGDHVLDLGCGNGQTTRLAAARTPSGRALGVDLSAPMLGRARATAAEEGLPNVTFEQADAQIHPFRDAAFEVALSRFGVMFYADPVAAFTNVARALRPGGRIAFLTMADPSTGGLGPVLDALDAALPVAAQRPGPGSDASGPLSLSSPGRIRELLGAAGFEDVHPVLVEATQIWGADPEDAARFFAGWGPVRRHLAQADEATAARVRTALTRAFTPHADGANGVELPTKAWLTTATHP